MNTKHIIVILCIFTATVSTTFANNIDTLSRWYHQYNQKELKELHKQILEETNTILAYWKDESNEIYDRFQVWKPSDEDIRRKFDACLGDVTCEQLEFFPSIAKKAKMRDRTLLYYNWRKEAFVDIVAQDWGERPFWYVKEKYGTSVYNYIIKNRAKLDKAYDKFIDWERKRLAEWKVFLSQYPLENIKVTTFEWYVQAIAFPNFYSNWAISDTTEKEGAAVYYLYRLVSDDRLYVRK